ncbi:hypothetical protein Drorol1_Dr00019098 [Drosera rotundifolia]
MPATAGRVRMPANNRVHSSAALQTHGIWQMTIKYDPYAPNKDDKGSSSQVNASSVEPEGENAYASFQGLLALAKITNSNNPDEVRGACKKCGRVGHLSFQCRNFLSVKDNSKEKDADEIQANVLAGLDRLKASVGKGRNLVGEESEEESDEESDDSDSSRDSEIERIIAERQGKRVSGKSRSSRKNGSSDEDKKERRRSKKRSGKRDEVDSGRKRQKRDESSDEDEEHKRRRRRDMREKRKSYRYTDADSSDEDEERRHRRRRDRKEKRRSHRYSDDSSSDEDEDRRRRRRQRRDRKEKRRSHRYSDDSSSDEDEERKHRRRRDRKEKRRSHRYSDDSEGSSKGHKSKSRRTSSMESDGYQSRRPHHSRESELVEKKSPKYADGCAE